jgi:hypothetical protein
MKVKVFMLFLCLLLVASVFAQKQNRVIGEVFGVKKIIDGEDPFASVQVRPVEKPGVLMLTCYVTDEDGAVSQVLKLSENSTIYFYVEYTATWNTNVAFHFILTGPEFLEYETDFFTARHKDYSYVGLYTGNDWKKGVYTLTVIAEQAKSLSGAECVAKCKFRFY